MKAVGAILSPLSALYATGVKAHRTLYSAGLLKARRVPVPVICIGNLSMGGTGKTPIVEHVARCLQDAGYRPAIVSRGYKRKSASSSLVLASDSTGIRASTDEAGDEPVMLAAALPGVPVAVCADRFLACQHLWNQGMCDCVLLDDGFQHWRLYRDIDVVLLDAGIRLNDMRVFPAGTLREPLRALRRALIVIHTKVADKCFYAENRATVALMAPGLPQFAAKFTPSHLLDPSTRDQHELDQLKGHRIAAVAGIARPEPFFESLRQHAAEVIAFPRPDHAQYSESQLSALITRASAAHCDMLVTTAKDAVKILELPTRQDLRLLVLVQQVEIDKPELLMQSLLENLPAIRSEQP